MWYFGFHHIVRRLSISLERTASFHRGIRILLRAIVENWLVCLAVIVSISSHEVSPNIIAIRVLSIMPTSHVSRHQSGDKPFNGSNLTVCCVHRWLISPFFRVVLVRLGLSTVQSMRPSAYHEMKANLGDVDHWTRLNTLLDQTKLGGGTGEHVQTSALYPFS